MDEYETLIIRGYDDVTKIQKPANQMDAEVINAGKQGWEIKSSSLNVVYLQRKK
jgi:hypothetical protein